MFTIIYDTKRKQTDNIVTQQHEVDTYMIINNDPSLQGGSNDNEEIVHKKIRIKAIKLGNIITGGTILSCKSKYAINEFKTIEDESK